MIIIILFFFLFNATNDYYVFYKQLMNYKEYKRYLTLIIQGKISTNQRRQSKGFLHRSEKMTLTSIPPRPINQNQTI
jgi:hypothetical protein